MTPIETGLHYPLKLNNVPKHWEVGYVGDFASDIEPGFASGEHNQEGTGVPHLRPMNIDRAGKIDLNVVKYVDPAKNVKRLRCGDVLFNNTNSPELIGKTSAITNQTDWAFSNHMTRIAFSERVDPKFAAYQLHFLWMTGYFLHKCVKHVNQASVSSTALARTVPFIRPPLEQQKQIVAEIEKQFSRLDEAVANLKRVKANLKRYKAAVLKAAVEGKLVPTEAELARHEGRAYETGAQLLERILTERRQKWQGRSQYREPVIPDPGSLSELPKGWGLASLEAIADVIDPNPSHRMPKYVPDGIPLMSSENFVGTEGIDFSIGKQVARETLKQQRSRYTIDDGDFVLSRIGTIGKTRFLPTKREYCLSHALVVLKVRSKSINKRWLRKTIESESILSQARKGVQSVGVPDLGMAKIREFAIPLPPLAEQQRIVAEVERRLSVVEELEAVVNANLQRATLFQQSTLQKAFTGQL